MGTVIQFTDYDKKVKKVLVLDAHYRSNCVDSWGMLNKKCSLPNISGSPEYLNLKYSYRTTTPEGAKTYSDEQLNSFTYLPKDPNSAKYNCDTWLKEGENYTDSSEWRVKGVHSVSLARSIKVNGIGCDIPNIQTLARIFCDADTLDSLDPTGSSYSNFLLGSKNSNGTWRLGQKTLSDVQVEWSVRSSSQAYSYYNWEINYQGYIKYQSLVADQEPRIHILPFIPILELS